MTNLTNLRVKKCYLIVFRKLLNGGTEFQVDMNSFSTKKELDPLLLTEEEILQDDFLNNDSDDNRYSIFHFILVVYKLGTRKPNWTKGYPAEDIS